MSALSVSRLIRHTRSTRMNSLARLAVTVPLLLWLTLAPAVGATAQQVAATPSVAAAGQSFLASPLVAAPDAPSSQTVTVPGMQTPNGLAVHGTNRRIYVTSRDNDMLYMLDPTTFAVLGQTAVGDLPWGVAVDWAANRVYVANFGSANVMVFDSNTLARLATIDMGPGAQPTFVDILPGAHRVFVANNRSDTVAVINSDTNTVEKFVKPGDTGAWGLAVNPNLNQVYVTFRTSATLVTLDAAFGWDPRPGATIQPCGSPPDAAPYGLAFDQYTSKLYLACAPAGGVNTAVVYYARTEGLMELKRNLIDWGGSNGGGVAVSLGSESAFFTNSASDTVSIVSHPSNQVTDTEPTGDDPFAVAIDFVGRRVIVGNRGGNSLTVFTDPYLPAAYAVNGVAVNTQNGKVYVTSRDNNLLLRLKGNGAADLETFTIVGRRPWGIAVNPNTDRVFVANFDDGNVQMLDGTSMANFGAVSVGGEPTFVEVDAAANRVFTVSHAENKLVVINGATNVIERTQPTGGDGAFGLAVNTKLNRAYVSHRRSGDIATMDGTNGWQSIENQRINACGAGREPYAMAFNPANDRLYVACATNDNVDTAVVYRAAATGLTRLATLPLQAGGSDGGGGIAVNPLTGNVFFTNSEMGTVSTVNGSDQLAGPATPVGLDPFGIAADPSRGFVYVGLRLGNNVVVLRDTSAPSPTGPRLFLSRQDGCQGVPLTVFGAGFTAGAGHAVELRMDGTLLATATVDTAGAFMTSITVPGPKSPGGVRTIVAADTALPAITARASLRTPRTDLPVIFMGGIAGSKLVASQEFKYEIPGTLGIGDLRTYALGEEIWLGTKGIDEAILPWPGGNDKYFYPLRLASNGLDPFPDPAGRIAYLDPPIREPLWTLSPGLNQPDQDVYLALYNKMQNALSAQGRSLFYFGYDWRKNLNVSDPLLDKKINEVLAATGKDKVILVGHSMGGILSRYYILNHGAAKVDQVITFGTPYLGSVNPAKYLEMGDDMGMLKYFGPLRLELDPAVVKEMALNYEGLYQMLPSPLWFNHSPFDGASFDPRYLGLAFTLRNDGGAWSAEDVLPQSYDQIEAYLARNYNPTLVAQADAFYSAGVGDLTRMTDQYINQRIVGTGTPTWGHIAVCQRPCWTCTKHWWDNGYDCGPSNDVPAVPALDALGDDTVPLRSGAGSEPLSKMLLDGHYYFVDGAHHMTLGTDTRVQDLVVGLLQGNFCTNAQALPPGNPGTAEAASAGISGVTGLAPDAAAQDYAALGTTTGVQLTLIGNAVMTITDAQGRRLAPSTGLLTGYANSIPGANMVEVAGAQVAALTTGGPFTVTISGTAADGAARLKVDNLRLGAIVRTLAFPSVPVTTTTTADLTLAAASVEPDTVLTYRYTADSPAQELTATPLEGGQAGDATPPTVKVTLDSATGLVTVTASDGDAGSGVMQLLYSAETAPAHFVPYVEPFAWPAGAQCVTGLAQDRAGNTGAGRLCRTWLPMLIK